MPGIAVRFFILFVFTYVILYAPISGAGKLYERFFRATGNALYSHFADGGVVILQPQKKADFDSRIFISKEDLRKGDTYTGETYDISSYLMGFLPTVFFISLMVATPLSWKRKLMALGLGYILVTAYVMFKLRIFIQYVFSQTAYLGLYQGVEVKKSILFWTDHFAMQKTVDYTFILILWMALCIGKKEWQKLNAAFSTIAIEEQPKATKKSIVRRRKLGTNVNG